MMKSDVIDNKYDTTVKTFIQVVKRNGSYSTQELIGLVYTALRGQGERLMQHSEIKVGG